MPQKCPNCSEPAADGANFCATCGASLRSQAIDRMVQDARRTLDNDPGDLSARYNLGLAYKLGGMHELALKEFTRVAEMQPDFADVHCEQGLLYLKLGRREDALAAARRALELEPDNDQARRLVERLEAPNP